MNRRAFVLSTLALFFVTRFGAASAMAAEGDPESIVQAIYAAYGPEGRTADLEDKYFSPDLLTLYDNVAKGAGDNVELAVDFDVFLNAQDIDQVTNLQTTVREASDARQVIDVTFTAFGQETIMRYVFVAGADGWKIDDISWGEEGAALRPMLEELLRAQKDAG